MTSTAAVGSPRSWRSGSTTSPATASVLSEPGAAVPPSTRWLYEVFMRAAKRARIPAGRDKGIALHDLRWWSEWSAVL